MFFEHFLNFNIYINTFLGRSGFGQRVAGKKEGSVCLQKETESRSERLRRFRRERAMEMSGTTTKKISSS